MTGRELIKELEKYPQLLDDEITVNDFPISKVRRGNNIISESLAEKIDEYEEKIEDMEQDMRNIGETVNYYI